MKTIRLAEEHSSLIKPLFKSDKFMGITTKKFLSPERNFEEIYFNSFCNKFLNNLENYHAFATFDNSGDIQSLIGFYESIDDPSWYWMHIRSAKKQSFFIKECLDHVIKFNENRGRYKFYSMFPIKYINLYRRLAFSKFNSNRYDSIDEFYVKAYRKCNYELPWNILYSKMLAPVDTVVRCSFLKKEFRNEGLINGI